MRMSLKTMNIYLLDQHKRLSLKIVFDKVVCKVLTLFILSHVYEEFNKSLVFKSFSNAIW